jgi:transcriptional regulator with XRE-family HTH domain
LADLKRPEHRVELSPFKQALGNLIVELRKKHGLSQERLALDADVDRTRIGEIERGEANPTIDTLERIAKVVGQTLGSLIIQAEEISSGTAKRPAPTVNPQYIDRTVALPSGLTHEQLEAALNRALALLDQIGLNPENGDIQWNIYSGAVSNIVTKAIAETSDLVQNKETAHPNLYNPNLDKAHPDWGLEMKATYRVGKGGESHNPGQGWFMIVVYKVIEGRIHFVQVETALLSRTDWVVHERGEHSNRTRTAVTIASATQRLRENSVYMNPDHLIPSIKKAVESRRQAYLS